MCECQLLRMWPLVAVVLLLSTEVVVADDLLELPESVWLMPSYLMRWGQQEQEYLVVECQVKTKGYIGWGVSPQGAMIGADIIITWVDATGKIQIKDYHGQDENTIPLLDESQDVEILQGYENGTHTTVRFRRKLDTCDKQDDMKIVPGSMRVIFAYNEVDPETPQYPPYHGYETRGTTSLMLVGSYGTFTHQDLPPDATAWDITIPQVRIPHETHTTYWCHLQKIPPLREKNHIIMAEPVVQEGHESFVHHLLVTSCKFSDDFNITDYSYMSEDGAMCDDVEHIKQQCRRMIAVWAIGGRAFWYPDEAGYPISPESEFQYVLVEMHYDNPGYQEGFVDSSGMRMWYTPSLRRYDAGTVMIGSAVTHLHFVPPNVKKFVHYGYCTTNCTNKFPEEGIQVIGGFQHSHLLGKKMITRHYRKERELKPLMVDDYYDFNYQDTRSMVPPAKIERGDIVQVECHYDSSHRSVPSFGGESTQEEMCLVFLVYYPYTGLDFCLSIPSKDDIFNAVGAKQPENATQAEWLSVIDETTGNTTSLRSYLEKKTKDFWKAGLINKLQKIQRDSEFQELCIGPSYGPYEIEFFTEPPFPYYKPYIEADSCIAPPPAIVNRPVIPANQPNVVVHLIGDPNGARSLSQYLLSLIIFNIIIWMVAY